MAVEEKLVTVSLVAGADLSGAQYKFVKLNASGQAVLCSVSGEIPYGVLQNDPASGEEATVAIAGITKVSADEAIAIGDKVFTSADGQAAKTLTAGVDNLCGIARSAAAAAGEIVSVDFRTFLGAA